MAPCVCLGPGGQNLRIAGCVRSKPEFKLLGKRVKDFWDEENIVPPLQVRAQPTARSHNSTTSTPSLSPHTRHSSRQSKCVTLPGHAAPPY